MVIIRPFLCVLFPLWLSIFFWCNDFAFSEVGGVSHLYLYSPMFNYRAVNCRTRKQSPLSFYPSLTISILSRLSLCLTFITIASDTS